MAEQPRMTEFEMALEAAEKVQTQPKAKVHWPAPGAAGAAYPSPPKGARPQQAQPLPGKLPGAVEEKEEQAKSKPPMALIAVAVVLVLVAAGVFYFMKKGGGAEAPASDETAVEEPAAAAPAPGRTPAPAAAAPKPAGAPAAAAPSSRPKPSASPAPAKPAEPQPKPIQEYPKITQGKLDQLVEGLSYEEAIKVIGGEGKPVTDTINEQGEKILVFAWPTEGLGEPFVSISFVNGQLAQVSLVQ